MKKCYKEPSLAMLAMEAVDTISTSATVEEEVGKDEYIDAGTLVD